MKEFYYFMGGVASLFIAQLIVNYNFSDWVKDKVLALIGKLRGKL